MDNLILLYRKLFGLRHSEVESVIIFQLIFFILLFSLLMVKPTSAALFISEFGPDELPRAFIMVAVVAGGVTQLISWMNRYPIATVIKRTILLCSAIFISLGLMMSFNVFDKLTPYILYLWVSIFALVSTSQFWLLGNMVFNADQAKRLFGLIGSGSIAGAALGGYFSSGISILGGAKEISILVGSLLLICIPLTRRLIALNQIHNDQKSLDAKHNSLLEPFRLIMDSSLLKTIAVIVLLNVLVSKIIDYHFGVFASRIYPNEDELSAFYGFTYSTYNVIGFLIQLFFTSKVLKRIGVSNTLLILPISVLVSFFGLILLPGLFFAILLKMSDTSFKQSFQRSGIELTMIPIPHLIKAKVKPFIDVFIDSVATGLAGILLIILTASSIDRDIWTFVLGVILTIAWALLTYKAKNVYFQSFANNISHKEEDILSPREFKENLKQLLADQRVEELQSMLTTKTKYEGLGLDDEMVDLYTKGNENLKLTIMDFLYFNPEIFIPFDLKKEIKSVSDAHLKQSIMSYAVISDDYKDSVIYPIIDDEDWKMQIITVFALVKYYGRVPYLDKTLHLKIKVPKLLQKAIEAKEEFYIKQCLSTMIMYKIENHDQILSAYLYGDDKFLKKIAIQIIPSTGELNFLKKLIALDFDAELNQEQILAIAAFDEVLIDYLALRHNRMKADELVLVSNSLGKLPTQASATMLLGFIVDNSRRVRQAAAENLSQLLSNNPNLNIIEELINKRIIADAKHALNLANLQNEVDNKAYFIKLLDGNAKNFWIHLRLGVMMDKQFILILQLIKVLMNNTEFEYLQLHLKKENKVSNVKALELLKAKLNPTVFAQIAMLLDTYWQESNTKADTNPKLNKAKLTNLLLKLNDKTINQLLET